MVKIRASVLAVDVVGLEDDPGQPLYVRLQERFRAAIRSGALPPNSRVPSARTLAVDLRLARNTVDGALSQLAADGYIVRRRGAGSFVSQHLPERDARPITLVAGERAARGPLHVSTRALGNVYPGHGKPTLGVPFTPSLPALELFPRQIWGRLLQRAGRRPGPDFWAYGPSNGLEPLRRAITSHASAMRGIRCSPEQVIVVTSAQQAIELAAHVLADHGEQAWVESPGYPAAAHGLRFAGLEIIEIPVDADGIDVSVGRARAPNARIAYVTPSHQYPMGVEMSVQRRIELLQWASDAEGYIIEDDYDGDYRYEGRPITSLQSVDAAGRVIYVGTFNKVMFPSLRLSYMIVPDGLVDQFWAAKHIADGHTASLSQAAMADFIDEGHLATHLRRTRMEYDERRLAFLQHAAEEPLLRLGPAKAGMHVTGRFTEVMDDRTVADKCRSAGVEVHPLSRYGTAAGPGLVFGFACSSPSSTRASFRAVRRALASVSVAP